MDNFEGLALETTQPRLILPGPIYAPRVEVMCNGNPYDNISSIENRTHVNFPSFTPNKQLPSADFILPFESTLNDTTFDWVKMPAGADNPAIGAAVRVPTEYLLSLNDTTGPHQGTEIHACSIYAQWVPVDVWYEPRTSDQVSFTVKGKLDNTCLTLPHEPAAPDQPARNISISMDYANAINQDIAFDTGPVPAIIAMMLQVVFQDPNVTTSVVNQFKSPLLGTAVSGQYVNNTNEQETQSRATLIATLLAGQITDGLARIAGNGLFPYAASMFLTNQTGADDRLVGRFLVTSAAGGQDETLNSTAADVDDLLRIDPVFKRYGYGYRWDGSKTVQFGIIVLLIHLAIAATHTAYIIYVLVIRGDGMVISWSTVAELISLAMNSSPSPRLQDTCAGVEAAKTWRQVVSVRETYPGHLEMVVGPDEKARHPKAQAGRLYGRFGEDEKEIDELDEFFDAKE